MSWDEALFSFAWRHVRRWREVKPSPERLARRVDSTPERPRLEALARLLSRDAVTLAVVDGPGGHHGDVIEVPRIIDFAPTRAQNERALLAAVAWACSARSLGLSLGAAGEPTLAMALSAAAIGEHLSSSCPGLAHELPWLAAMALRARPTPLPNDEAAACIEAAVRLALGADETQALPHSAWLWAGRALAGERVPKLKATKRPVEPVPWWGCLKPAPAHSASRLSAAPDDVPASASGTARQKPKATAVTTLTTPPSEQNENPLVHSFEKVHTVDTYKGGSKRVDGDDELEAHQRALDELDLTQVVRTRQRANSLYQVDAMLSSGEASADDDGVSAAAFTYDEWHEAAHRYRRDWCSLTERSVALSDGALQSLAGLRAPTRRTTRQLRAVFEHLEASRTWRHRQLEGDDVDVDAVVDRYAALRAGFCSQQRLYSKRRRHTRDTAVFVLVDTSLSTDAWVANRRVIDVEKEAVIALGDALEGLDISVGIAAFASHTRRDCRFLVAKGFEQPWSHAAPRIAGLEPAGFTRVGPALRHATATLNRRGARRKVLLVISDARPTDVDQYEGRYGLADVRRAVLDAQACGVVTHALAVDPAAKRWLPAMFGHGRASIAARPEAMVPALAELAARVMRA